ncbi:hypothetical protein N658DRAFT_43182 [Parathielavia hyrcaniae]|uniref:Uncharacterized protein n=1 Tax=Parathielavia hyrcaniae TaxID=113614 RepID=A0AAN6Q4A4_9PEZI|nr:hypothetical protein N658DRAFT_43182 [Parathielavia hyrcaniae]
MLSCFFVRGGKNGAFRQCLSRVAASRLEQAMQFGEGGQTPVVARSTEDRVLYSPYIGICVLGHIAPQRPCQTTGDRGLSQSLAQRHTLVSLSPGTWSQSVGSAGPEAPVSVPRSWTNIALPTRQSVSGFFSRFTSCVRATRIETTSARTYILW